MSRRRKPSSSSRRDLVLTCTGGGMHPRRVLRQIPVWANTDGTFEWDSEGDDFSPFGPVVDRSHRHAWQADGDWKGLRARCPRCPIDLVLKDSTLTPVLEALVSGDRLTYEVDVSGGANVSEQ